MRIAMPARRRSSLANVATAALALVIAPSAFAVPYVGVTPTSLVFFDTDAPGVVVATRSLSGLQPGEQLLGIDRRPTTGQLFALGNSGRLYAVDAGSGVATAVGAPFGLPLIGANFGFDFNPSVDRIRIVSDAGQNLRVNPDTGAIVDADPVAGGTQADGVLNGASTSLVAAAYTNNVAAAPSTTLIGIDANSDRAYIVNPPNAGTVVDTVGGAALAINVQPQASFDIGADGVGYLYTGATSGANFYRIPVTSPSANVVTLGSPVSLGATATPLLAVSALGGVFPGGIGETVPVPMDDSRWLAALVALLALVGFGYTRRNQRSDWPASS